MTGNHRPPRWLQALRSALFNAGMYLTTAALAVLALPTLLLPQRFVLMVEEVWTRLEIALLRITCGLTYRVRGLENLPAGAVIVAAKHHSTWETLALAFLVPRSAFVIKRELTWIPVFGWYLTRAASISVDRSAGAGALRRMLKQAKEVAASGRPIVIFPEGTRAPVGASLPYQPGTAALYGHLGLPVVPVALNSGVFWGRRRFIKWPGVITVDFLKPIPPGLPREEFMAELRRRLEARTELLVAEASAQTGS